MQATPQKLTSFRLTCRQFSLAVSFPDKVGAVALPLNAWIKKKKLGWQIPKLLHILLFWRNCRASKAEITYMQLHAWVYSMKESKHTLHACVFLYMRVYARRVCVHDCDNVCRCSVLYASEPVPAGIRKVDLGHKYLISVCCP